MTPNPAVRGADAFRMYDSTKAAKLGRKTAPEIKVRPFT